MMKKCIELHHIHHMQIIIISEPFNCSPINIFFMYSLSMRLFFLLRPYFPFPFHEVIT